MTKDSWRELLRQVLQRLAAMDPSVPPGEALGQLTRELGQLEESYEEERARELLDARRRLADLEALHNANRLVTVGTLTAAMAHELGTPLGVVLARAQMILTEETDVAEVRADVLEIIHQVKRMTQMCREVLDFARPSAPRRDPIDVAQIVRQTIVLLVPEARMRTARLVLEGDPPPMVVVGDPSKLMQILTNLTINAAQAMPVGGTVTLAIETKHVDPPDEEGLPARDYVCIHVQDTGTGIRRADLGHIFDTFFTTKTADKGSGLGLSVSSRIAREHAGWLGVVSEEGRGSTFTVYLPAASAAA